MRSGAAEQLHLKDQAGTGEARLGFLEFGDVERRDVEAAGCDALACAREGRGKNDCFSKGQRVGGVWFGGIDVDPVVARKRRGIEPRTIGEERVATEKSDSGLEMEASGHGNGDDLVIVRLEDRSELADAFGVASFRETDEKLSIDTQNVAALEGAGEHDMLKFAKFGKG